MKINTNSWHFAWARFSGFKPYREERNLCEYVRHVVLWSPGLFVLVIAVGVLCLYGLVVGPIMFFTLWAQLGFIPVVEDAVWIASAVLWLAIALAFIITWVPDYLTPWLTNRRKQARQQEPGVVAAAWRSFKQKTCVNLEFK